MVLADRFRILTTTNENGCEDFKEKRSALLNEMRSKVADLHLSDSKINLTILEAVKVDIYEVPFEFKDAAWKMIESSQLYNSVEEDGEVHIAGD